MLKKALLACTALGLSVPALAADVLYRIPDPAPVVAPVDNWTGFYVGLNAGYGNLRADSRYVGDADFLNIVVGGGLAPTGHRLDADGFIGGAQLGFNWQFGPLVAGIEGDIQYTDLATASTFTNTLAGGAGLLQGIATSTASLDWLGTLRARFGFALDRFLVYGTGGFAFGDVTVSGRTDIIGLVQTTTLGSRSQTQSGWTLGGGVEWAWMPNLTLRGEYLYYDLGSLDVSAPLVTGGTAMAVQRHEVDGHLVRAGVNFRF